MNIFIVLIIALVSYSFGSISISRLVSRLIAPGVDLENVHLTNEDGSEGNS